MKHILARTAGVAALAIAISLGQAVAAPDGVKGDYAPWGLDAGGKDHAVKPGDDFFKYVNGGLGRSRSG